jgi:hypothetical protein
MAPTWLCASLELTIFSENDAANAKAVEECRARWANAGRGVLILHLLSESQHADLNDVMRGRDAP